MKRLNSMRLGLFFFTVAFATETWLLQGLHLEPFQWVLLALAGSMVGRSVSYLKVLEWLRWPFIKEVEHSSGAGADNHPRHSEGLIAAVEYLFTCPVCSTTWGTVALTTILKFLPAYGEVLLYIFAAAAAGWLLIWLTEYLEWHKELAREQTGYMNWFNKRREKQSTVTTVAQERAIAGFMPQSNGHDH